MQNEQDRSYEVPQTEVVTIIPKSIILESQNEPWNPGQGV
jgi:hypothetical protein